MDLYIYLCEDAPFIQDGRRLSVDERSLLDKSHRSFFENKPLIQFNYEGGYEKRLEHVIAAIEKFLTKF